VETMCIGRAASLRLIKAKAKAKVLWVGL
jgi:hypothetical protein